MPIDKAKLLDEALSETGVMPFYEGDADLVNGLCEIIGSLHRELENQGVNAEAIRQAIAEGK